MKTMYVLIPDYDYEGYGVPRAIWDHPPTEQEIFDFLVKDVIRDSPGIGFLTVEETNEFHANRLWETIRSGCWEIAECEVVE